MDKIAECQASVADAVKKLRAFSGKAGSSEMQRVQLALEYLGYAYSALSVSDNPAWADD